MDNKFVMSREMCVWHDKEKHEQFEKALEEEITNSKVSLSDEEKKEKIKELMEKHRFCGIKFVDEKD